MFTMSLSDNLDNVAFLTKYPVDKIVKTIRGSFTVGDFATTSSTVSHGMNRRCFSETLYSIDDVTYYSTGQQIKSGSGSVNFVTEVGINNVVMYADNYSTGSTKTIYYRIMIIWPI